jgi:hypothetical protein
MKYRGRHESPSSHKKKTKLLITDNDILLKSLLLTDGLGMLGMLLQFLELELLELLATRLGGREFVKDLVGEIRVIDILLGHASALDFRAFFNGF